MPQYPAVSGTRGIKKIWSLRDTCRACKITLRFFIRVLLLIDMLVWNCFPGLQPSSKSSSFPVRMENSVPIVPQNQSAQSLQIQPSMLTQVRLCKVCVYVVEYQMSVRNLFYETMLVFASFSLSFHFGWSPSLARFLWQKWTKKACPYVAERGSVHMDKWKEV